MFKKYLILLVLAILVMPLRADEGMWLPIWLQQKEINKMHQMGMAISFDDIYNQQKASLKDAVVSLDDGGCTGEFVSSKGLLLTNYHCGFSDIQKHSSIERDYIKNGFWAKSYAEELPNINKTATLLVRAVEVTHLYEPLLKLAQNELERMKAVDSLTSVFQVNAVDSTGLEATIVPFFNQSKFVLFLTKTFRDVRLVGTPPDYIGSFGGEIDNWIWPRHTGDFCYYRVYCTPNGEPADYSPNNVPYQPAKFLNISTKGLAENDFTFIMGYPGTTNRYATSADVEVVYRTQNNVVNQVRLLKQNYLKKQMELSPRLAIQYASKYDNSANYQKYALGQNLGIEKLELIDQFKQKETWFTSQLMTKGDSTFYHLLARYNDYALKFANVNYTLTLIEETLLQGAELPYFALQYLNLIYELSQYSPSDSIFVAKQQALYSFIDNHYKDYSHTVDWGIFELLVDNANKTSMEMNLPFDFIPKKYGDNAFRYARSIYNQTVFSNHKALKKLATGKISKKLKKDPVMALLGSVFSQYETLSTFAESLEALQNETLRWYYKEMANHLPDSSFYPDANSTMRLSFGTVKPYCGNDGIFYNYFTTQNGIVEKIDNQVKEFKAPAEFEKMLIANNFGKFGVDGTLPVCFITTNDITGGNSGSPVMNKYGELIGLAFDGNWEGMTSDLAYYMPQQRTICVDIRYVLWVTETIGGASHLINEMVINE